MAVISRLLHKDLPVIRSEKDHPEASTNKSSEKALTGALDAPIPGALDRTEPAPCVDTDSDKIQSLNSVFVCQGNDGVTYVIGKDHDNVLPLPVGSKQANSYLRHLAQKGTYGIAIPVWLTKPAKSSSSTDPPTDMAWENIEIRIRKDNKIAYSYNSGPWFEKTFADISLLDRKTQKPNRQGSILIALSMGMKYPEKDCILPKDKTSISKLRNSLKIFTGIDSDPFTSFTNADGWKPRFKLTDRRKDAYEREKVAAIHEKYEDDKLVFDQSSDPAGKWLDEND